MIVKDQSPSLGVMANIRSGKLSSFVIEYQDCPFIDPLPNRNNTR